MKADNFRLDEVVVTAKASKAGQSTASTISRTAMDHMQTSSLADLMQLLPGGVVSNPNLSSASTMNIRAFGNYYGDNAESGALNMNSLGTAIIMDGSPISNNANMQSINSAINGSLMSKGDVAVGGGVPPNSGVDLRQISTDNIESVEVIRGIPSAEYGDLTAGAVIVNSKAGKRTALHPVQNQPQCLPVLGQQGAGTRRESRQSQYRSRLRLQRHQTDRGIQILSAGDRQTALFECMARREMALEHLSRLHLRPQYDGTESR